MVTSAITVEYVRPARTGPLRATATVETATTTRTAVCRAEVSSLDGICAVALGRVARL